MIKQWTKVFGFIGIEKERIRSNIAVQHLVMIYAIHSNSLHVTKNLFSITNHEDNLNYGKAYTCIYSISLMVPLVGVIISDILRGVISLIGLFWLQWKLWQWTYWLLLKLADSIPDQADDSSNILEPPIKQNSDFFPIKYFKWFKYPSFLTNIQLITTNKMLNEQP